MRELLATVRVIAVAAEPVLVEGESGTGKEVIARALHCLSGRSEGPWVNLNCSALPDELLESELFGSEATREDGQITVRAGMLEFADGGTLFLDEVGDLEMRVQAKLLRVLDGLPFFRINGASPVRPSVRLVAATNQDLAQAVAAGRFRADLFHRLTSYSLRVPPLRDRVEDIVPLAEHFLAATQEGVELTDDVKSVLESYGWPGNVRELRNVMNMCAAKAKGNVVRTLDLPERLQDHYATLPAQQSDLKRLFVSVNADAAGDGAPGAMLQDMEKRLILQVLEHTGGHQERAAGLLGISRRTLSRKLKQYGAEAEEDGKEPVTEPVGGWKIA